MPQGARVLTNVLMLLVFHHAVSAAINFRPVSSYPVGTVPGQVAVGDLNGDGKVDLAVVVGSDSTSGTDGGISLLLGNGDGTFQPAVSLNLVKDPAGVAAVDLNGDGLVDLVVTTADSGVAYAGVLIAHGDGTFRPLVNYVLPFSDPGGVIIGDFNGDHIPDILVGDQGDGTLSVLIGNGDGTLKNHIDTALGQALGCSVIADFNGDDKADLAVAHAGPGAGVSIFLGKGDGTFQTGVLYDTSGVFGPTSIAPGDFNGDGELDLIVDFLVSVGIDPPVVVRRLDLMTGSGDGTFTLTKSVVENVAFGVLSAADFDGDGKQDYVLQELGQFVFVRGNGDGTFQSGASVVSATSDSVPLVADLNDDSAPDLIATDSTGNHVVTALNAGTDFTLSASPLTPGTLMAGHTASSTVTLTLLNDFINPASLTCSVAPEQAGAPSCSLNPATVTFDRSGTATAQLTVAAGSLTHATAVLEMQGWLWCLPIAGLVLAGTWPRAGQARRTRQGVLIAVPLLLAGLLGQTSCGGGSSVGGGTNARTFSITVTATSGVTQHVTVVNVQLE